jgi:hypothetical protein
MKQFMVYTDKGCSPVMAAGSRNAAESWLQAQYAGRVVTAKYAPHMAASGIDESVIVGLVIDGASVAVPQPIWIVRED